MKAMPSVDDFQTAERTRLGGASELLEAMCWCMPNKIYSRVGPLLTGDYPLARMPMFGREEAKRDGVATDGPVTHIFAGVALCVSSGGPYPPRRRPDHD